MAVVQRNTRQRAEVIALLDGLDEFRSAQQIHEMLRSQGSSVGLATVYRAVQTLTESGEVDVLRSADGEAVYRRCERRSHHHHLVCRVCGRAVEIDGPGTEAWAEQVAASFDFADVDHTIELVGTCADCRRANAERDRTQESEPGRGHRGAGRRRAGHAAESGRMTR